MAKKKRHYKPRADERGLNDYQIRLKRAAEREENREKSLSELRGHGPRKSTRYSVPRSARTAAVLRSARTRERREGLARAFTIPVIGRRFSGAAVRAFSVGGRISVYGVFGRFTFDYVSPGTDADADPDALWRWKFGLPNVNGTQKENYRSFKNFFDEVAADDATIELTRVQFTLRYR